MKIFKTLKNHFFQRILNFEKSFFSAKEKILFSILGLSDLTRALQSSQILRKKIWKNVKNPKKNTFFPKKFFCTFLFCQKKCSTLSFSIFGGRKSTKALQYSLFQNPGAGGGGSPEPDERSPNKKMNGRSPRVQ